MPLPLCTESSMHKRDIPIHCTQSIIYIREEQTERAPRRIVPSRKTRGRANPASLLTASLGWKKRKGPKERRRRKRYPQVPSPKERKRDAAAQRNGEATIQIKIVENLSGREPRDYTLSLSLSSPSILSTKGLTGTLGKFKLPRKRAGFYTLYSCAAHVLHLRSKPLWFLHGYLLYVYIHNYALFPLYLLPLYSRNSFVTYT